MTPSTAPTRLLLLLAVSFIVYGSLYPGTFQPERTTIPDAYSLLIHSWPQTLSRSLAVDFILNILIYIPVGLLGLVNLPGGSRIVRTVTPVCFAFLLSASMELLQAFIPTRVTSLPDLLANTFGAMLGVAVGRLFTEWLGNRLSLYAAGLYRQPGAGLLLALWISAQCFPFIPGIGLYQLHSKLVQLLSVEWSLLPWKILSSASGGLAAMVAFEVLASGVAQWSPLLPLLLLSCRFLIHDQYPSVGDVAGTACAAIVGSTLLHNSPYRKIAAAALLLFSILMGGLAPFDFQSTASQFSWMPFKVSLESGSWENATAVLFAKSFKYGAAVWLLFRCGISFLRAGIAVAILLGLIEWIQIFLPGRSAELTDPFLCLVLAVSLWLLERTEHGRAQTAASNFDNTPSK